MRFRMNAIRQIAIKGTAMVEICEFGLSRAISVWHEGEKKPLKDRISCMIEAYEASKRPINYILEHRGLKINLESYAVTFYGKPLKLTKTEFDLALYFMQHIDIAVHHRDILLAVWGPAAVSCLDYLRVGVMSLRKKLVKLDVPPYLITVNNVGYMMASCMEEINVGMD